MEAALKTVAHTAELLAAAAHSAAVATWDQHTASRAFRWARYCEHLSTRLRDNPAVGGCVERRLRLTNQSLRSAFPGCADVSLSDLCRSQHLLLVGLLNNPELPVSVAKMLFDTASPVNREQGEHQDVTGLCSRIIQCRSACKVLSPLTDPSAVGADAEVQGAMLTERLGALLGRGGEAGQAERFLDSVLQGCAGAAGRFCLVIAAALLTTEDSAAPTAARDFLLDWLRGKKPSVLQYMCSALPSALILDLAKEHLKFRDAYCDVLKKWASDMEYSVSEGEWVHTSTSRTVSFQRLTEHFLLLFEACPSLKEDVEKELNALKISDGDFDVRGLSVWGDLLSALNK